MLHIGEQCFYGHTMERIADMYLNRDGVSCCAQCRDTPQYFTIGETRCES